MAYEYKYDDNHEAPFAKQLKEMVSYHDAPYYEIWVGTDGYAVSSPEYKVYDSDSDDDTAIREDLGIDLEQLNHLVLMRAGTAYALSPEYYEDNTGTNYPYDIADKYGLSSIVVMVVSRDDALSRIHAGKFAS